VICGVYNPIASGLAVFMRYGRNQHTGALENPLPFHESLPAEARPAGGEAILAYYAYAANVPWFIQPIATRENEVLGVVQGDEEAFMAWNAETGAVVPEDEPESAGWIPLFEGEGTALERWQASLSYWRRRKIDAIDDRTRTLITAGFAFGGHTFSLSAQAQMTWLGMFTGRNGGFAYPVAVNTRDDSETIALEDASAVEAFYGAATAAVRLALDSGTALKQVVRMAETETEILEIEDDR